jgi:hypothetical protein
LRSSVPKVIRCISAARLDFIPKPVSHLPWRPSSAPLCDPCQRPGPQKRQAVASLEPSGAVSPSPSEDLNSIGTASPNMGIRRIMLLQTNCSSSNCAAAVNTSIWSRLVPLRAP